ncbi:unnamed protein product [Umbelopsis ramanniana]
MQREEIYQFDCSDSNVQVFVRIRPPLSEGADVNEGLVHMVSPSTIILSGPRTEMFSYDQVGSPETTQDQMFEWVGVPIVNKCIQGYNGTIFAYGQTGSGKTYTMQGRSSTSSANARHQGVIPRSLKYLFELIEKMQNENPGSQYICRGSYVEIYNEYVYDLLDPLQTHRPIREDIKRGVYVDGVTQEIIGDHHSALRLFQRGVANRHVSETAMNRESSRSHAVFTLTIQSKILRDGTFHLRESKLNMVDLAGSERQRDTKSDNARLKEAANINKSLLCLGGVINALSEMANGTQRHVHYRDSKLTFLLRDSLGGNSVTYIIANIDASPRAYQETLSTLRFAQRAKMIKNTAIVNQNVEEDVLSLKQEVSKLQQQLHQLKNRIKGGSKGKAVSEGENISSVRTLLRAALEKQQEAIQDRDNLREQIELAEDFRHHLQQQIELDQLLLNAKDKIIYSATYEDRQIAAEEENKLLKQQIYEMQRQADEPSELSHSRLENLNPQNELFGLKASRDVLEMQTEHKQQEDYTNALSSQVMNLIDELNQSLNNDPSNKPLIQKYQEAKIELQKANDSLRLRHEQVQFNNTVIKRQQAQLEALSKQMEQNHMTTPPKSKENELQIDLNTLRQEYTIAKEKADAQRLQILEVDNMLQSERKMRQELEMQHIQEKNELTALIRRLEGENEKSVAAQHRIEQELKHIIDESNAYRVQLSTFNKQHQATNQRLKESERRLKTIEDDKRFDLTKQPREVLYQDHMAALEVISMMKRDLALQINDVAELLSNKNTTESGLSKLTSQICDLTLQMNSAEDYDAILNKAEESTSLKTTVARLKAENSGMREIVERYKRQAIKHREREESLSMYRSQFSDHQQQQSVLQEKVETLVEERDAAVDQLSILQRKLSEIQHVTEELQELKEYVNAVEETNSSLIQHQNNRQKIQYHVKIKQENNDLRAENSALKLRLKDQSYEEVTRKKRRFPSLPSSQ